MIDHADAEHRHTLLEGLVESAIRAGLEIMRIFASDFEVIRKSDASPVTAADHAAEALILQALAELAPGVAVVAEEEAAAGRTPAVDGDRFFLVDPLDGTKEFVRRGHDFTVNIGLIEFGAPTLGVVYAPARRRMYAADVRSKLAWTQAYDTTGLADGARHPLGVRSPPPGLVAVASKSHDTPQTDAYLKACTVRKRVAIGSSLKFCLLAAGEADLYPRPAPTSEWDTAAGHAVLQAAGGCVLDLEGGPLRYGKPGYFNPGFLALGGVRGLPSIASVVGLSWSRDWKGAQAVPI